MKKPNIIFFVMDALRASNVHAYGYERNTTPNIDKIANDGLICRNVFSSNNATDKSLLAILSGRHTLLTDEHNPLLTQEELNKFKKANGKLLPEILKKNNYATYWIKEIYGWQKRGIDYFMKTEEGAANSRSKNTQKVRNSLRKIVHHLPKGIGNKIKGKYGRINGEEATNKAIEIIKKKKEEDKPFFMWVDYNDTHIPYNPRGYTGKFKADKKGDLFFKTLEGQNMKKEYVDFFKGAFSKYDTHEDIIARYDSAIFYNDYLIGKVIDTLKKEGMYEDTIICIFSDHGESFDSQRIYFNHHGLYDSCTHVPLIIKGPRIEAGSENKELMNHEDLVPTLLEMAEIEYDKDDFDGENFFQENALQRHHLFMEEASYQKKRGIRTKKYKYIESESREKAMCQICNEIHGGVVELYNLENDPDEKINIANERPEELIKMKTLLRNHVKGLKQINEKRRIKSNLKSKQTSSIPRIKIDIIKERILNDIKYAEEELDIDIIQTGKEVIGVDLKEKTIERMEKLKHIYNNKEIDPHFELNLNRDDALPPLNKKIKIGIFPISANPPHWAHLFTALDAIIDNKLDKIVFLCNGNDPRKPDLIDVKIRYEMLEKSIKLFEPFFTFSNLAEFAYMDDSLPLIGEYTVFKLLKLNKESEIDVFYMAGSDHLNRYKEKDGKRSLDTVGLLEQNIENKILEFNNKLHTVKALFVARDETEFTENYAKIEDPKIKILHLSPTMVFTSTQIREAIKEGVNKEHLIPLPYINYKILKKHNIEFF
jgi:arylsulfatase A-like enzyme/nicotinic acid mononucleotide adenylyltransferase